MKIAVIGAGLSGLVAARELTRAGHTVTVFEKSRGIGGRLASRRVEICGRTAIFDHGAQNIKAPGSPLDTAARELLAPSEFIEITQPVWLHDGRAITPGDVSTNAEVKWTCRSGITALPKALARGLDVRFEMRIAATHEGADCVLLSDESGAQVGGYDRVILTAPAPQCAELLQNSNAAIEHRKAIELLEAAHFRNCLSLMLWFEANIETPWYALLATDRAHPLLWAARGNLGDPSAPGTYLVAQFGAAWSHEHYDDADDTIVAAAGSWLARLLGPGFRAPSWSQVKRWRFAQPESMLDFEAVNASASRIVVCGDALAGGKAHHAYDSGLRAAQRLMAV